MSDILCLGEILVDWVSTAQGQELDCAANFTKAPGGAPANVAVGLARQDVKTAFIGRVSNDAFGTWLKELLDNEQIDTSCVVMDKDASTRMAYVVTTESGDRKLAEFSRIACADTRLSPADLKQDLFKNGVILHFGSISLIAEPASTATHKAIELAKQHNMLVSYDPNVRLGLWPSPGACKQTILETLSSADIVKINLDELEFLTSSRGFEAADALAKQHSISLLIITLDANGCYLTCANGQKTVPGFKIQLVEATGAGDGFVSAVLAGILPTIKAQSDRRKALTNLSLDSLVQIAIRANAVGALACTRPGAIPALPKTAEVDTFLEQMAAQSTP